LVKQRSAFKHVLASGLPRALLGTHLRSAAMESAFDEKSEELISKKNIGLPHIAAANYAETQNSILGLPP